MKWVLALLAAPLIASAADVAPTNEWNPSWQNPRDGFDVSRKALGAGSPARHESSGLDRAAPVADGLYHVPNSMPGFPTSATIWPRTIPVDCVKNLAGKPECFGYDVNLDQGRGEYIYIQPVLKESPPPKAEVPPIISAPPLEPPIIKKIIKKKRRIVKKKITPPALCK